MSGAFGKAGGDAKTEGAMKLMTILSVLALAAVVVGLILVSGCVGT